MLNGKVIYYQNNAWVEFCTLLANHCISFSTSTLKLDQSIYLKKKGGKNVYCKYLCRKVYTKNMLSEGLSFVDIKILVKD